MSTQLISNLKQKKVEMQSVTKVATSKNTSASEIVLQPVKVRQGKILQPIMNAIEWPVNSSGVNGRCNEKHTKANKENINIESVKLMPDGSISSRTRRREAKESLFVSVQEADTTSIATGTEPKNKDVKSTTENLTNAESQLAYSKRTQARKAAIKPILTHQLADKDIQTDINVKTEVAESTGVKAKHEIYKGTHAVSVENEQVSNGASTRWCSKTGTVLPFIQSFTASLKQIALGVIGRGRHFLKAEPGKWQLKSKLGTKMRGVNEQVVHEIEDFDEREAEQSNPRRDKKMPAASSLPKANAIKDDSSNTHLRISKEYNLKIALWNVSGLREVTMKSDLEYFNLEKPNIICLNEVKCLPKEVLEEAKFKGYHAYWNSESGGRDGVAILSKMMPYNVTYGIADAKQKDEGRLITAEYEKFYLCCIHVPKTDRQMVTRQKKWNKLFEQYVIKLNDRKPVAIAVNVAHQKFDGINLLSSGFTDTFRYLYPAKERTHTFWTDQANARSKNVGFDYFIMSNKLASKVVENTMRINGAGSEHCPIVLFLNL